MTRTMPFLEWRAWSDLIHEVKFVSAPKVSACSRFFRNGRTAPRPLDGSCMGERISAMP